MAFIDAVSMNFNARADLQGNYSEFLKAKGMGLSLGFSIDLGIDIDPVNSFFVEGGLSGSAMKRNFSTFVESPAFSMVKAGIGYGFSPGLGLSFSLSGGLAFMTASSDSIREHQAGLYISFVPRFAMFCLSRETKNYCLTISLPLDYCNTGGVSQVRAGIAIGVEVSRYGTRRGNAFKKAYGAEREVKGQ